MQPVHFDKTVTITRIKLQRNKQTCYIRMFTLYSIHERTVVLREGVPYTHTLATVHATSERDGTRESVTTLSINIV